MKSVLFFQFPWRLWRERLSGIYRYAAKAGWQVGVAEYGRNFQSVSEALGFWKPDGVIVEGGYTELPGFRKSDFRRYPTVFCDANPARMRGGYSGVVHDSAQTALLAAKELLGLRCGAYAYVGNFQPRDWSERRQEVFANAVSQTGCRFLSFGSGESGDFAAFRARLRGWLSRLPRPCGLLAANDATADIVLRELRMLRIKVPEEVAVMGIDNDSLICENTTPTLTSVAPDFEKSGYLAAEMLDALMGGRENRHRLTTFGATQVIHRGSTRMFKRLDDAIKNALEFIRHRAGDSIKPRDVVRVIGGSRRQAEYRFREFTGKSIGEELLSVRIEMAKKLLSDPRVPIGIVAQSCGYGNDASFRRAFKSTTGMSLGEFRNMAGN